jgi:hypothetical protein
VRGYYEAREWRRDQPDDFAVLAYDALMVGYHTGRAVVPSALLPAEGWEEFCPNLYVHHQVRYLLWSDFYPADRAKAVLSTPEPLYVFGHLDLSGRKQEFLLDAEPVKVVRWETRYAAPGWLRPWRRLLREPAIAIVYRFKYVPPE